MSGSAGGTIGEIRSLVASGKASAVEICRAHLERARALEPRLSAEPGDYRVIALSLKGEVAGDAEIGYQVERLELSVQRP